MKNSVENNEQIIKKVVKEVICSDCNVEFRLMGGMSNYTYVITIDNKKYTFRVPGKGAEHFTDREKEFEIIGEIKPYDFQPAPIYFDVETGYKIAPFVEGEPVSELSNKPTEAVAQLLKKLHSIPKFKYDYNPLERLEKYESITETKDPVYLALKDKWLDIYEIVLKDAPLVAAHGDSQTSNFVVGNDRLYLLDWEFAGNNDPIYDIACYGNANFDHAKDLMEVYFENPGREEYQRLYAWRMFQCLQWHNVAKYKHQIGLSEELAVDFSFFASAYLDKAKGFFQDYLDLVEAK
ncbi:phosphotransferase [Mycoplasma sp. P36-A1]|uniref:phosphotransferase n=1 Tax=Mycoplasma sp. P36-A1 TaxID=3252900 RepID=UPI003C2EEBA8